MSRHLCLTAALLLAVELGGCAGAEPPPVVPATPLAAPSATPTGQPDPDAGRAPTPYTVAQLRTATRPGRSYEFLVEQPGQPPVRRRMIFVLVSDERVTLATEQFGPDGTLAAPAELSEASWDELRRHASYPKETTRIEDDRTETPAGQFDCWRYTVVEQTPDGEVRTMLWFAKNLPGPPVETNVERGGEIVSRTSLLRYAAGFEQDEPALGPEPASPGSAEPPASPPQGPAPDMLAPGLR